MAVCQDGVRTPGGRVAKWSDRSMERMEDDSENHVWRCKLEVSLVSLVCMISMNRIFRREYSQDIGLGHRRRRSCGS